MPKHEPEEQRGLFPEPKPPSQKKEPMIYIVPANTRSSRCRGENCQKIVYWITVAGRRVVVDCEPIYPPNRRTLANEPHPSAEKCFAPAHPQAPGEYYGHGSDGQGIDHHATCADVKQFGRKTERKNA